MEFLIAVVSNCIITFILGYYYSYKIDIIGKIIKEKYKDLYMTTIIKEGKEKEKEKEQGDIQETMTMISFPVLFFLFLPSYIFICNIYNITILYAVYTVIFLMTFTISFFFLWGYIYKNKEELRKKREEIFFPDKKKEMSNILEKAKALLRINKEINEKTREINTIKKL